MGAADQRRSAPARRRPWTWTCPCHHYHHHRRRPPPRRCGRGVRGAPAEAKARHPRHLLQHPDAAAWYGRTRRRPRRRGEPRDDAERRQGPTRPWRPASASAPCGAKPARPAPSPPRRGAGRPAGRTARARARRSRRRGQHRRSRPHGAAGAAVADAADARPQTARGGTSNGGEAAATDRRSDGGNEAPSCGPARS